MKDYFVCGIGNAIVDVTLSVSFEEMEALGLVPGKSKIIDLKFKKKLDALADKKGLTLTSGGSIANSIYTIAALGQSASFIGTLGKDNEGQGFYKDFLNFDIAVSSKIFKNKLHTGTCYCLVTPDAERAMLVFLGDAASIKLTKEDKNFISSSDILLLEMYPVSNNDAYDAIKEACEISKNNNKKIAMSFSDLWVVKSCKKRVREFAKQSDIIFANEHEAMSFANVTNKEDMISYYKSKKDNKEYVITLGKDGVILINNGEIIKEKSLKVAPVDLTGAGDMFLAAYLYGVSKGLDKKQALKKACCMSSKVICQIGARLQGDIKKIWNSL